VGPTGEAAAVFQPPAPRARRGERGGLGHAGPQGQLGREAGAGPTAGSERGGGRLASWAAREGEGAAGPKGEERGGERKEKVFFLFFYKIHFLDECFHNFNQSK
jgi:hypothetical protein